MPSIVMILINHPSLFLFDQGKRGGGGLGLLFDMLTELTKVPPKIKQFEKKLRKTT